MTVRETAIAIPAPKPLMRGTLHAATAALAPFGLVLLLLIADSPSAYVGASIFAASLCALYTTSATYHLGPWRGWTRGLMRRLDHSMIFALIAGTYPDVELIDFTGGAPPAALQADAFFGGYMGWPEILTWLDAAGVRWVQLSGTGVDNVPSEVFDGRVVTCARGASAVPISEFVMAAILSFAKRLPTTSEALKKASMSVV